MFITHYTNDINASLRFDVRFWKTNIVVFGCHRVWVRVVSGSESIVRATDNPSFVVARDMTLHKQITASA